MAEWRPDYVCLLDTACVHPSPGHSLSCQEKNKVYAEAVRQQERERRLNLMDAVIRGDGEKPAVSEGAT